MADSTSPAVSRGPIERPRGGIDFRLAGRLVQPALNRIQVDGTDVQVEPKIMQVLLRLVERSGDVVTKDQLIEQVWEGVFVTEDVLVRAIGELRRIFEDEGARGGVIETIRKRGYRLIVPVVYEMPAPGRPAVVAPVRPRPRRILVRMGIAAAVGAAAFLVLRARDRSRAPLEPRFTPVTTLMGNEYGPALSPDGTRVAFAWDGGPDGPTSLNVKMLGTETILRLTDGTVADRAPAWSPDGSRIAFLRYAQGACEVMVVSGLGGAARRVAPCSNRRHPRASWSTDGKWLVQTGPAREADRAARLRLLHVDTLETREVSEDGEADTVDTSPAFSPEGGSIAFIRQLTESVGDLYLVPATGGPAARLTFDNADIMGFAWAEAGRRLVFSSNRAGMYSLWSVAAAGGEPELLSGGGRKIKHPSANRAGDAVVYEAWNYDMNLWQLGLEAGAEPVGGRVAPASDEWTFEPRYSPDGTRIAFASTRSGTYEIWTCRADGADPTRLTSFGGPYVGLPRWSPDGKRLAFVARPEGRADVYVVDVDGGPPRRVTTHPLDEAAPSWSADGAWIYFASRRDGDWQVRKIRAEGGEDVPVTERGGYAALESPDGRALYFTRIDRAGLWRRPVEGGAASLVTTDLRPEDWAAWGVVQGGVYWQLPPVGDAAPTVVLLEDGAREPRPLASLGEMAWPGLDLSPDRRRLLYSRLDRRESNLVLLTLRPRT